jgi:peptidyl-tRNA hydrolase
VTPPGDPLVMYFVVRKDARLGLGQAMALAGAAADACAVAHATGNPVWDQWWPRQRKVALRATADEIEELRTLHTSVGDDTLLCLAPLRRSERSELLAALRPFTDAKAPAEPPARVPDDAPALLYVIRPGVMKTTGKAMAQAGHAALIAADEVGGDAFAAWRAAGRPGEVVLAPDDATWSELRERPDAAVIADGGLTQVEPGTETVIGLAPAPLRERPELVRELERVA